MENENMDWFQRELVLKTKMPIRSHQIKVELWKQIA